MAPQKPRLTVVFASSVGKVLQQIWDFNASQRGAKHAEAYDAFLQRAIKTLSTDFGRGKIIRANPNRRFIVARLKPKGAGHIIVYSIELKLNRIRILQIFHTKQDWRK